MSGCKQVGKRIYTCFDHHGRRRGCAVLICTEETALLTAKNIVWVKWWANSTTERILVMRPSSGLNCSVGTILEIWERRWDWSFKPPRSYVVLVWKAVFDDYTLYPVHMGAWKWESGEMKAALEEITLNPRVLLEELRAALQQHARLFVS